MKKCLGIIILLFLTNTLWCEGKDTYIYSSSFSSAKKNLKIKTEKKSNSILFKKSKKHKLPLKPKKKKRSRGVEPVHYYLIDLREQFNFNNFSLNQISFQLYTLDYSFKIFTSHNKRGPPSSI